MSTAEQIQREPLLDASLRVPGVVERVHIARVTLAPGARAGIHSHPCHVVGQVLEGEVDFQIQGGSPQRLGSGDAFHEPSHVRITRFDNASAVEPAVFVAYYLLPPGEDRLILPAG